MLPEQRTFFPKGTLRNPEEHHFRGLETPMDYAVVGKNRWVKPGDVSSPPSLWFGNFGSRKRRRFPMINCYSSTIHLLFGGRCSAVGAHAPSPHPTAGRRSVSAADFVQIRSFPLSSLNCGIVCPALPLTTEPTLCHPVWFVPDGMFRRFRAPNPFFSPKGPNHVNIC
jgi:hypothetical protein